MTIQIRDATVDDAPLVSEFNAKLAAESEHRALDPALLAPGVRAILGDSARGRYFLAFDGDRVLGQLSVTYEWSDWRNGWFWWFQSVYVIETARRLGVFSALYDHVLRMAQERDDVCGLRLYVDNANHKAQATYAARGMASAGYRVMEMDFRSPPKGDKA